MDVEIARRETIYEYEGSYDTRPIPILLKEPVEKPVLRPPAKKVAKGTMRHVKRKSAKRRQHRAFVSVVTKTQGDWTCTKIFTQKLTSANTSLSPVPFVRGRYGAIRRRKSQPKGGESTLTTSPKRVESKSAAQSDAKVLLSKFKRSVSERLLSKLPGKSAKYEVCSSPIVRGRFPPVRRASQKTAISRV